MRHDLVAVERTLAEPCPSAGLSNYSILSVDDDDAARYVRRRVLEGAGFRVIDASDGPEALRLANAEEPSLVLLDIRLPGADGFSVCERLKMAPKTAAIPVVHVSAVGRYEADLPESLRRHSDAYLREPVEPETLVAVVTALIRARESERLARQSDAKYQHLADTALEAIWVVDGQGTIQFVNDRLAGMLQYTAQELEGRSIWDLAPSEDTDRLKVETLTRITGDASDRYDVPLCRRDGSIIWLSGTGRNIRDNQGVTTGRTAVFMDITERKRAQDALMESQQRLELALNVAELGTWEADIVTGTVTASLRTCAMFGFKSERPCMDDWMSFLHPEDRDRVRGEFEKAIEGLAPYDAEFRLLGADGGTRWVHAKGRRVCDGRGRPLRLVGVAQDVTARKEAEAARERQRAVFEAIVENIPVMLCLCDPALSTFQLNRECQRVLGWTKKETNASEFLAQVYPDAAYRESVSDYMHSLAPGWRELDCVAHSGETIPCEWANIELPDHSRIGIGIDLRPRKQAEEALRRSEASLRERAAELLAFMDALPVATFVARDSHCHDVIGSRMTYELLRLPCGSNVSASAPGGQADWKFRFVRDGHDIPAHQLPAERAVATGAPVRDYEFDIVYDDGTTRNLLGNAVPLLDDHGVPWGAVAAFLDITDRKRAESHLRETQKLESVGLLAGGIAHDFNNLLTAIMGNTSIVIKQVDAGPAARLKGILRSAERAANLIRQLLAYSGKAQVIARLIDVTQAVTEMRALMEISVPKSVRLCFDLEQRLPSIRLDPSQLEQILMNLVINAGEAIGPGNAGTVRVTTALAVVDEPFTDGLGGEITPGRYLRIEVSDTGSGMEPETIRKVFEPFFSTKFAGRGLGLAAVAGIVRSQHGAITVKSTPGQGSTFRVLLPAGNDVAAAEPAEGGRGVVLVADDDDSVREFIADVARGLGYRVLTACDGSEALAVCAREQVDVVVLDVVMPVMGANLFLPKLKAMQSGVRILLTSGYSETDARRLCVDYPDIAFVQKPYTAHQIEDAIEGLLASLKL